jgi:hypothetical protein
MSNEKYTIYDLETPANLFTAGFKDYATGKRKNFIIHESQNDLKELIKFLRALVRHDYYLVGFRNLGFDAQIIEYLIANYSKIKGWSGEHVAERIHELSQKIINMPDEEKWLQLIPEWDLSTRNIDVAKQQHYDRPAKATSLKWLEFTMRFPNIESMPIHHSERLDAAGIPIVLSYMDNDVDATYEFFKRNKFETDLRLTLSAEYDLNLLNASEPRMARDIFGKFLSEKMGVPYRDLKERRTYRSRIYVKDLIFKYVKFRDETLRDVYNFFHKLDFNPYDSEQNNYELKEVKKKFKFHNITADVGLGGIHGCVAPGVYENSKDWIIEDIDGKSYYPNLGIENELFPQHLSRMFCKVYRELYEMRQKIDKKNPINYIFKIILNSAYGLSKEPNNYFHDPAYTYAITINGQLLLLKLAELMKEGVPGLVFYQFNTDGISIGYDPKYKDRVEAIKQKWTKVTKIVLENKFYKKLVIVDVNNYIAVEDKEGGKIKRKGLFGYSMDPEDDEMRYHKNPSALVIPKALEAYFINGTPFEKFVKDHTDIYDFCCGVKVKKDFNIFKYFYNKNENKIEKEKINQQVVRYYISNETASLKKVYKEGSKMALKNANATSTVKKNFNKPKESNVVELEKDWNMTYFNVFVKKPMVDYNLNYNYYLSRIREVVDQVQPNLNQIKMF